jgi:hypothetical protein
MKLTNLILLVVKLSMSGSKPPPYLRRMPSHRAKKIFLLLTYTSEIRTSNFLRRYMYICFVSVGHVCLQWPVYYMSVEHVCPRWPVFSMSVEHVCPHWSVFCMSVEHVCPHWSVFLCQWNTCAHAAQCLVC